LIQAWLVEKYDIFVRGAITEGLLYIDENYVFGSGLASGWVLVHILLTPNMVIGF